MFKVDSVVSDSSGYRVSLVSPKGFTTMWISKKEYQTGIVKVVNSNMKKYLELNIVDVNEALKKYKKERGV